MHDIDESCDRSVLTCADTFIFHLKLPLVIEIGVAFIAVEGFLVLRGHFPDNDGNCTSFTFLNREVRAGLAALEKQFIVIEL